MKIIVCAYNGCTQCPVILLLIIITELNQVTIHFLPLRAILIVTIAIIMYAPNKNSYTNVVLETNID